MERRIVVSVFVALLAVGLLTPGAVATVDETTEEATIASTGGIDTPVLDRLRAATTAVNLSRADTDGVLEQPTRGAIFEAIEDTPGIGLVGIAAAAGVTKSTARYHVDVLRKSGLVGAAEVGGCLRFAPADVDAELAAALEADATGEIIVAVERNEPASVTEVADATDRAVSTVSHHLSALEERGLLERERNGEAVVTTLTPATRDAVLADVATPADD